MTSGIKYHKVSHFFENSSNQHQLPHPGSKEFEAALAFVGFTPTYKPTFKIIATFDIPYLCGYDTEKFLAYFDKDFSPRSYDEGDATDTLLSHEQIEKTLEDFPAKWDYHQRHHVATWCEQQLVLERKWNWDRYSTWTTRSWHASYAKWTGRTSGLIVPATLDMSPYTNEHEKIISDMRKAGAEDKGNEP